MSGSIERAAVGARVVGLGDLLRPREPIATAAEPEPQPDPRALLEQERARVFEAARNEGYAAGMRDAEQRIEKRSAEAERVWREKFDAETRRLGEAARNLEASIAALPEALAAVEGRVEAMAIEIAFAASARVVATAARDETMVIGFCREALAEYALRPAVLRVHPSLLSAVRSSIAEQDVRIESDAALAKEQCRIESARGLFDIDLADRLETLKRALLASLENGEGIEPAGAGAETRAASQPAAGARNA